MHKTIAVTGATGFIGAAVVRRLAALGGVRTIANSRKHPQNGLSEVTWIGSSLTALRSDHWERARASRLDALLHLAAFTPKRGSDHDCIEEILESNVFGLRALLDSLPQPPRRFVFCSTLDVYSEKAFRGRLEEGSPIGPRGLYGASKLFGEALVGSYAEAAGTEYVALRLGHIYGPGEDRYAKLVPETIRRVLAGQPPTVFGEGLDRRDLLYVEDAAEAIIRAASAPLNGARVINVARGTSVPVLEIVRAINRELGRDESWMAKAADTGSRSIAFDPSLMRQLLGEWPMMPLEEGLRREIAWFRARS
jgi:UDP-glucose 4-epimerase